MDMYQVTAASEWADQTHQTEHHRADLDRLASRCQKPVLPSNSDSVTATVPAWLAAAIVLVVATLLLASVGV
ncbi:MAG: hypothetical protein KF883_09805 [Thermomicrobiales bacterium]|nr:hypothetical protein [Thermomicrobiales bacterium]